MPPGFYALRHPQEPLFYEIYTQPGVGEGGGVGTLSRGLELFPSMLLILPVTYFTSYLFYIYNMFTFYCIIFSKLSKNKSRKLLVLRIMPCLFVFIYLLPNYIWHTQILNIFPVLGALPWPHRGRGHVTLNRVCNGQRGRPLRAKRVGHRKRKIFCFGRNFKFSGFC